MTPPRWQPTWTYLLISAVVLTAPLLARQAIAQAPAPPYSIVLSDEGAGLFCIPQSGDAASKEAAMALCLDWLESGAGKQALHNAILQACQPQGSNATLCDAYLEQQLGEGVDYIEQYTPQQVVSSGDPLAGGTLAFLATPASTILTGAAFQGSTYANGVGTALIHLNVAPTVPGYNIVYSTTTSPLTSFQGSDGNTYPVYAILYGGLPPPIPAVRVTGLAMLSLALLLVGVLAITRRP